MQFSILETHPNECIKLFFVPIRSRGFAAQQSLMISSKCIKEEKRKRERIKNI